MGVISELFTEKFRPKNLNQLIVVPRVKEELNKGLVQNLLLYSSPGTGKTSTLFILAKDHPTLYMNTSEERGIETVRGKITEFCSSISLDKGKEKLKCVVLEECLDENENIRIGTLESYKNVKLKNLQKNEIYECPSLNMNTGELENDTCKVISIKDDDIYEVELEDGRIIRVTSNHPFIILDENKNIVYKTIDEKLNSTDRVVVF
jgi:DNA polymerase III delta prime subunit